LTQSAELTSSYTDNGISASAVSISGNTVVVGAPNAEIYGGYLDGAAFVFTEPQSGWTNMTQTAALTPSDAAENERFGNSVSISGNTVVVGGYLANIGGNQMQGAAYVFTEPASGWVNMTQSAKLTASDGTANDWFGASVSVSGNTVVVGTFNSDFESPGEAYVFTEPSSGWANMTQTAIRTASDGTPPLAMGESVWVTGSTVVVGNLAADAAYVFTEPDSGWANMTQTAKLTPSDGPLDFGTAVTMSGDTILVGSEGQGAAYVFNIVPAVTGPGQEILTNSQSGFWSTSSSTWTSTASGLDGSSLLSSTPNGSKESQAAWWFSMPAGLYEISITYTAAANLTSDLGLDLYDGVGNWIGQIPVNEQVAPSSFTEDGVAWENLESFEITSNLFHISTWNSSTDGAVCINGIQLQAAPVIDDADVPNSYTYYPTGHTGTFATAGSWTTNPQGAFGSSQISGGSPSSGFSIATWTMPVTAGSYEVDATWAASPNLSGTATYNVYDASTELGSITVNQQAAPSGVSYDGQAWQMLGSFVVTGTQLSVTLVNVDGQVDADTVRILPAYQPTPIVASGSYSGFWDNSGWTTQSTGLYGTSLLSNTANGSEQSQAAWWFPVQPGEYEIYVTWVPGSNLSSTTPFDIYNAKSYISTSVVNEQESPVGVTDQGVVWQSLGTFMMTSDALHVSTWNSQTNGAMNVSGFRIVPVAS
jgi:hypothetical protein